MYDKNYIFFYYESVCVCVCVCARWSSPPPRWAAGLTRTRCRDSQHVRLTASVPLLCVSMATAVNAPSSWPVWKTFTVVPGSFLETSAPRHVGLDPDWSRQSHIIIPESREMGRKRGRN